MNKIIYLIIIMLFMIGSDACGKARLLASDSVINPGDLIGDFQFTTGDEKNVTYPFDMDCDKPTAEEKIATCRVKVGEKINITTGAYDDTFSGKLEERWSSYAIEQYIGEHPFNREAFGTIDIRHPLVGKIRFWNIVMAAKKPGETTVRETGMDKGIPFEFTTVYIFSK